VALLLLGEADKLNTQFAKVHFYIGNQPRKL